MSVLRNAWVSLLPALFGAGCATAPTTFGHEARYAPAYAGYVMAKDAGSDDPGPGETVLLLRDPLTGKKLRCQSEVMRWRELHEDLATDAVHDQNTAIAIAATTGAVFGTLVAGAPVGALLLAEAMLTSEGLFDTFASANATELLARGITLYRRKRFGRAREAIELALAKDPSVGEKDQAYLYLGLAYAETHERSRAKTALELFIDRSSVRDVKAYRLAEKKLGELGARRSTCSSQDPVELRW